MIFRGAYDDINGVRRPYITIRVRSANGAWLPVPPGTQSGQKFRVRGRGARLGAAHPDAPKKRIQISPVAKRKIIGHWNRTFATRVRPAADESLRFLL